MDTKSTHELATTAKPRTSGKELRLGIDGFLSSTKAGARKLGWQQCGRPSFKVALSFLGAWRQYHQRELSIRLVPAVFGCILGLLRASAGSRAKRVQALVYSGPYSALFCPAEGGCYRNGMGLWHDSEGICIFCTKGWDWVTACELVQIEQDPVTLQSG